MNLLLLGQHYAPEEVSGAVLATELATDLVNRDHRVNYVTCAPNYPNGHVFKDYKNYFLSREQMNGVNVVRVWSHISASKSTWHRLLNYGTFSANAFFGGLAAGKPDVIFSYSPPLPLGISAFLLSRLWNIPWILRVEDLFPEAAVAAGLLRNHQLIRFFSFVERFLYQKATHISLISEGFRKKVLAKGISANKLSVTPVWADPNNIYPSTKHNGFRSRFNLGRKFILMYTGNMGYSSALEEVIGAADLLNKSDDISFVLIGEGVKKEALQKQALQRGLTNILFLPFQPREQFNDVLAAADMGLVTLNKQSSSTSLPSKTFNIMASGRPILAITPSNSEIAHLIESAHCGINIPNDRPDLLAKNIINAINDPMQLDKMGKNGRAHLEDRFSRDRCIDSFDQIFRNIS